MRIVSLAPAAVQRALPFLLTLAAMAGAPAIPRYVPEPVTLPQGAGYVLPDGSVAVVGYNDMRDILEALDARFASSHPKIRFALDLRGTRFAPSALARGGSAFAPMGAEFTPDQLAAYRQRVGSEPIGIRVAHAALGPKALSGPILIFVHPSNPLDRITTGEVARIFSISGGAGTIGVWGQAGLGGAWAGRRIHPCGLGVKTVLGEFMLNRQMGGSRFVSSLRPMRQSREVVSQVAADPEAIGFARANEVGPEVKILAVARTARGPYYRATSDNIIAGLYPYDGYLYIYLRRGPFGRPEPFAREYLNLVLSREGQQMIADSPQGYLPLNPAEVASERVKLGPIAPPVDPALPSYRPVPALSGTITVVDSPLTAAWASAFIRLYPQMKVVLGRALNSSQEAIEALVAGKVDLAWLAPEIEPQQRRLARRAWGRDPLVVAVATGSASTRGNKPAIAIYVNPANPISRLSLRQLDAIFSRTRKRGYPEDIVRWGQLGLAAPWTGRPIHRYGMALNNRTGVPHGWVYYLMERMLNDGEFKPDIVQVPDTAYGPGANLAFVEVVRDVAADPAAIAFAPFAYRGPGVKTLALAENDGGPYYAGTSDEVARRVYPLVQTKALAAGSPLSPAARNFLLFVLSVQGQEIVAADPAQSFPLPAAFAARERQKLTEGNGPSLIPASSGGILNRN